MQVVAGQHAKSRDLLFSVKTDYLKTIREKCKNALWYYNANYKRMKGLNNKKSESLENLQNFAYELVNAIGELKKEELLINHWSNYYAPFDGVVTKINYYSGSAVPDATCSYDKNNGIIEITEKEDYLILNSKGLINETPVIAKIAPMVQGIVEMKVKLGDRVKCDQLFFCINMDYNKINQVQQQAKLKMCKAKYERQRELCKANASSLKSYQQAVFDYKNAIQDLKATKLIINKRFKYRAPFDGTVTDIVYYSGSNAFAGHKVIEVTKL
ncbi:MAG: hypothetical protein GY718_15340 [Lentisphaerae bacterium]|nr:hypothetical protein [Lentisphaerota bacterium]